MPSGTAISAVTAPSDCGTSLKDACFKNNLEGLDCLVTTERYNGGMNYHLFMLSHETVKLSPVITDSVYHPLIHRFFFSSIAEVLS